MLDGAAGRADRWRPAGAQATDGDAPAGGATARAADPASASGAAIRDGLPGATFSGILGLAGRAIARAQPTKPQSQRRGIDQPTAWHPGRHGGGARSAACGACRAGGGAPGGTGGGRHYAMAPLILQVKAPLGPTTTPPAGGRGENQIFRSWPRKPGRRADRATMAASGVVRPWHAPCRADRGRT